MAYADLRAAQPRLALDSIRDVRADAVLVTPHWGPNMAPSPVPHVRDAAAGARRAQAHRSSPGIRRTSSTASTGRVLYDLGDFLDDYAVDPVLRNDLGLLWLVAFDRLRPLAARGRAR